jgi:hypothetical protein
MSAEEPKHQKPINSCANLRSTQDLKINEIPVANPITSGNSKRDK